MTSQHWYLMTLKKNKLSIHWANPANHLDTKCTPTAALHFKRYTKRSIFTCKSRLVLCWDPCMLSFNATLANYLWHYVCRAPYMNQGGSFAHWEDFEKCHHSLNNDRTKSFDHCLMKYFNFSQTTLNFRQSEPSFSSSSTTCSEKKTKKKQNRIDCTVNADSFLDLHTSVKFTHLSTIGIS